MGGGARGRPRPLGELGGDRRPRARGRRATWPTAREARAGRRDARGGALAGAVRRAGGVRPLEQHGMPLVVRQLAAKMLPGLPRLAREMTDHLFANMPELIRLRDDDLYAETLAI